MDVNGISLIYGIWQSANNFFSQSFLIAALKFFLFVYVAVLFANIVMLLMLRGLSGDLQQTLFGGSRPLISRSTIVKRWDTILSRLEGDNPSQYKVAVLEADAFTDEILSGIGYKGATMAEKLEGIHPGQLETKNNIAEAHQIRNRIVYETDFVISREEAQQCLDNYRKFFDEVELF